MSFQAVPISSGWGCDCSAKLTAASAKQVLSTPMAINGGAQPISFIFRYVSLYSPTRPGDIDPVERDAILSCGVPLLLVQHVNYPGWTATQINGAQHGNAAGADAKAVEYPAGAMLFVDLEGVKNYGADVEAYIAAWAQAVQAYGFIPGLYQGYSCGLDPGVLAKHTEYGGFWSDFGPRTNPLGFMCKQKVQISHCGVAIDPDQCFPDTLGRTLVGMAVDQGLPASDSAPDHTDTKVV